MSKPTRKDVAALAGVSVATVSYVLNGTKNVTPEVQKRVEKAVDTLHYRPNLVAKSLATHETRHVAMFVDNLKNPYYASVLEGAQAAAAKRGYVVSTVFVDYANREDISQLIDRKIDGAIITCQDSSGISEAFGSLSGITCLEDAWVDYGQAFFDAVRSLKQYGHKDIVYLTGLHRNTKDLRLGLFIDAMEKEGLACGEENIAAASDKETETTDERAGWEKMDRLLRSGKAFTAVIAVNDLMAIGAMDCLREHGIRVPGDVSVIGCDNIGVDEFIAPHLSSIDVGSEMLGKQMMEVLIDRIQHKPSEWKPPTAVYLERESTGPAPQ